LTAASLWLDPGRSKSRGRELGKRGISSYRFEGGKTRRASAEKDREGRIPPRRDKKVELNYKKTSLRSPQGSVPPFYIKKKRNRIEEKGQLTLASSGKQKNGKREAKNSAAGRKKHEKHFFFSQKTVWARTSEREQKPSGEKPGIEKREKKP